MKNIILTHFLMFVIHLTHAQIVGCTDIKANNYNASANLNDGSCTYNGANVTPLSSKNLGASLIETSGLIFWNNTLWSHNDDTDNKLYSVDTSTVAILQSYVLGDVINKDWEEISHDDSFIYVGDFGNNLNGNRTDLHILRVEKSSLLLNTPIIDTIYFSYSNQTNFTATGANNTDFDCEAFLVTTDSIYLFTKQWIAEKTSIYTLPKTPGTYTAELRSTINIQGLATGITYLENKRLAVICGYSKLLQPFFYLLYDFKNNDFVNGNKRKISVNLAFHQIEGIATSNGLKYYASNENFSTLSIPQKLHVFDLTNLLGNYVNGIVTNIPNSKKEQFITLFPNPANEFIEFKIPNELLGVKCNLYNLNGNNLLSLIFTNTDTKLDISSLSKGMYIVCFEGQEAEATFIKQ